MSILLCSLCGFTQDTTGSSLFTVHPSLSSSYTARSEFNGSKEKSFTVAGSVICRFENNNPLLRHRQNLQVDLVFQKFIDSTWFKRKDMILWELIWSEKRLKYEHSYSINFSTSILPSYDYSFNIQNGHNEKVRISPSLCPSTLLLGYGVVRNLKSAGYLNLSLVSLLLSGVPSTKVPAEEEKSYFIHGRQAMFKLDYGISVSLSVNRRFFDRLEWVNNSRIFFNGAERDRVSFVINNRLSYLLFDHFQLRLDLFAEYNPLYGYRIKTMHDFFLGLDYVFARQLPGKTKPEAGLAGR